MSVLTVRDATVEDVPFLAQILASAMDSHMRTGWLTGGLPSLSREEHLSVLEDLLRDVDRRLPDGRLFCVSWKHYIVALVDGVLAGGMCLYHDDHAEFAELFLSSIRQILLNRFQERGLQLFQYFERISNSLFGCLMMLKEVKVFHTEGIAVLPGFQGKGVIQALFSEAFGRARAKGYQTSELIVFADNNRAIAAYERAGYREHIYLSTPEFRKAVPCRGMMVMTAKLNE